LYENDGAGNLKATSKLIIEQDNESTGTIAVLDYDRDGKDDLFIGNRIEPQKYPKYAKSQLLKHSEGRFLDVSSEVMPDLHQFGIVNDAVATDFNSDGWIDLIVVGEWSQIGFYKNVGGAFERLTLTDELAKLKGLWFSVTETDVNADGLPDYIIGNIGSNTKYKATVDKPLKVFAEDFDMNGTWDLVLSNKSNGDYVPLRGRECSSQQMPFIAQKFRTYDAFANASIYDVYGDRLMSAYQAEITETRSLILINEGDESFDIQYLPFDAQLGPILSSIAIDLNDDDVEDLIVAGSIYDTEPETPRFDSSLGTVLISNGENNYQVKTNDEVNLFVDGNVKSLALLNFQGNKYLLATKNDGPLSVWRINLPEKASAALAVR
ncbi:VCBS repeat-containing protein, partial [Fulvivirga sp. RKSG066]|uniref:FG-GAP repeat domain-containing protein n=1 Tax=Fulvivirga aurantia TaxID=2529383 RepID=UPI00162AD71E